MAVDAGLLVGRFTTSGIVIGTLTSEEWRVWLRPKGFWRIECL